MMTQRINHPMIEKKLKTMEIFLRELENADVPAQFEQFRTNIVIKRFVERNIELSIEKMIDVCRHLVSALDLRNPESYAECFEILHEAGVVPQDKIATFQAMARYRNRLVHAYDGVDDDVTYGIFRKRLGDFRDFIQLVRDRLCEGYSLQ